jgi:hypothetical protein
MIASAKELDSEIVKDSPYTPAGGDASGVGATGVMVYSALSISLSSKPFLTAKALTIVDSVILNGTLYTHELVVGSLPSIV